MGKMVELYWVNTYPSEDIATLEGAGIPVITQGLDDGWMTIVLVDEDRLDQAEQLVST